MAKKDRNIACYANIEALTKGDNAIKFGEFGIGFSEDADASQADKFFVDLFRNKPEHIKKIKLRIRSVNFVDGSVDKEATTIELDFD